MEKFPHRMTRFKPGMRVVDESWQMVVADVGDGHRACVGAQLLRIACRGLS